MWSCGRSYADDSPAEAELLRRILSEEPDIEHVGSVQRLEELPSEIMRLSPDVVILDFLIGGRDPLQVIRELREHFPRLQVVVYPGFPDPDLGKRAFLAGSFRVVLKTIDSFAIKQAIRAAAASEEKTKTEPGADGACGGDNQESTL